MEESQKPYFKSYITSEQRMVGIPASIPADRERCLHENGHTRSIRRRLMTRADARLCEKRQAYIDSSCCSGLACRFLRTKTSCTSLPHIRWKMHWKKTVNVHSVITFTGETRLKQKTSCKIHTQCISDACFYLPCGHVAIWKKDLVCIRKHYIFFF